MVFARMQAYFSLGSYIPFRRVSLLPANETVEKPLFELILASIKLTFNRL